MGGRFEPNLVVEPEAERQAGRDAHVGKSGRAERLESEAICEALAEHDGSEEARVLAARQIRAVRVARETQSAADRVRQLLVGQLEQL